MESTSTSSAAPSATTHEDSATAAGDATSTYSDHPLPVTVNVVRNVALIADTTTPSQTASGNRTHFGTSVRQALANGVGRTATYLRSREGKNTVKFSIAFAVSSLFVFISALSAISGLSYLTPVGVAILASGSFVGSFLLQCLYWAIGGGLGSAMTLFAIWISPSNAYSLEFFLFLYVFIFSYVRAKVPQLAGAALGAKIVVIIGILYSPRAGGAFSTSTVEALVKCTMWSSVVTGVVGVLIFPRFAMPELRAALGNYILTLRSLLAISTRLFLDEGLPSDAAEANELRKALRTQHARLLTLIADGKPELWFWRRRGIDFDGVARCLDNLAKKAGTLGCESDLELPHIDEIEQCTPEQSKAERKRVHAGIARAVHTPLRHLAAAGSDTLTALARCVTSGGTMSSSDLPNFSSLVDVFNEDFNTAVANASIFMESVEGGGDGHHPRPWGPAVFEPYVFVFAIREVVYEVENLGRAVVHMSAMSETGGGTPADVPLHRASSAMGLVSSRTSQASLPKNRKRGHVTEAQVEKEPTLDERYEAGDKPLPASAGLSQRLVAKVRMGLWRFYQLTSGYEFVFALKTSLAVTLLSILAFASSTAQTFVEWRGEWMILTIAVTMLPTVGSNFQTGLHRLIGTCVGSVAAYIAYIIFGGGNPYALCAFCFVFAIPCMHIRCNTPFPRIGMITLLTFAAVLLAEYQNRDVPGYASIVQLMYKRIVTIGLGVIVVVIVGAFLWPYISRKELRRNLCDTMHTIALLYSHVMAAVIEGSTYRDPNFVPTARAFEAGIQRAIYAHRSLLASTVNEPRVREPFRFNSYSRVLADVQELLDRLVLMRIAAMRGFSQLVQDEVIYGLNHLRRELIACVLSSLYILGGSLASKMPLPPYLPDCRKSYERLIVASQRKNSERLPRHADHDAAYVNFSAYAVQSLHMIVLIDDLGLQLRDIFGEDDIIQRAYRRLEKRVGEDAV